MSTKAMRTITPELALIDSDLAAAARAQLPDPGDCLAARPMAVASPLSIPLGGSVVVPGANRRSRGGRGLRRALAVVAAFALAAVVTAPLLAFLPPNQAPSVLDTPLPRLQAEPERIGAAVSGFRITWDPVAGSAFYNLVLVRDGRRVDFWPEEPSAIVARSAGRQESSRPFAEYSWFVYPAFETDVGFRYGRAVASGTIALQADTVQQGRKKRI